VSLFLSSAVARLPGLQLTIVIDRETKQRTLEELDQIFSVPVGVFAKYQLTKALPYFIKRWIFFRRSARLEPLYKIGNGFGEEEDVKEKGSAE